MPTLLLRIAGPMQSWGTASKMDVRGTSREPSKSGIIGMIASALGRSREDSIDDLTELKFGVRIDQEGTVMKDFHTVEGESLYATERFYLQDAVFLVGLEGPEDLLVMISEAIRHPHYPLFLGRRSCPPAGRICLGMRNDTLSKALSEEPWLASEWYRKKKPKDVELEMVMDSDRLSGATLVMDVPVSFSHETRSFRARGVRRSLNDIHVENPCGKDIPRTSHDIFSHVRGD